MNDERLADDGEYTTYKDGHFCLKCGALVGDRFIHTRWHLGLVDPEIP